MERFVILALLAAMLSPGQTTSRQVDSKFSDRFLFLGTWKAATLRRELDEAAAAGYRVIAGVGVHFLVLEKVASPPATYGYKWVDVDNVSPAGAEGYRLVPLVTAFRGDKEFQYDQVFLMERAPGSSPVWSYWISGYGDIVQDGIYNFRFTFRETETVRLTLGGLYFFGHLRSRLLIEGMSGEGPGLIGGNHALGRIVAARNIDQLKSKVAAAAAEGYRVWAASDGDLSVLMQRNPEHEQFCEYEFATAKKTSTMERNLNGIGSRGFRLIPAAVGTYPKEALGFLGGMQTETFAIGEKCPGQAARFEYRLVSSQRALNDAAGQGYRPVAMDDLMTNPGTVFLERPAPN